MRIVAHNGSRTYGGGEKWTVLLLEGLQARGHEVHLYCNHGLVAEQARARGVDASIAVLGGHLALHQVVPFGRILRRRAPDAFLIATFKKTWLGGMAAARTDVPMVVARIGLDTDLPGKHWTYRLAFRRWIDAVLANADGIRRSVVAGLPGYDPARVATVYDGIALDGAPIEVEEARRTLGLPTGVPLVGAVTRLDAQKRVDRMLDTLALLPGVHCALAGTGELEAELRARARALGLEDRVHFLGFREDVARVLSALDVFLLTSDREGMANAMLEAMAAGVPVVSTPVSGANEALDDDRGRVPGLVVEPEPGALAAAVRGILDVPAVRAAMAEEGRRRHAERFSFDTMVRAWEGVLGGDAPARWHQGNGT
jgi:glycosyltransferase involved in cell wall biosynthesis